MVVDLGIAAAGATEHFPRGDSATLYAPLSLSRPEHLRSYAIVLHKRQCSKMDRNFWTRVLGSPLKTSFRIQASFRLPDERIQLVETDTTEVWPRLRDAGSTGKDRSGGTQHKTAVLVSLPVRSSLRFCMYLYWSLYREKHSCQETNEQFIRSLSMTSLATEASYVTNLHSFGQ